LYISSISETALMDSISISGSMIQYFFAVEEKFSPWKIQVPCQRMEESAR
jgi:hypothetical protein